MAFIGTPVWARGMFSAPSRGGLCSRDGLRNCGRAAAAPGQARVTMAASSEGLTWPNLDGKDLRIGIVSTRWHSSYVTAMVADVEATLSELNVSSENIVKMAVPGSFELPVAARLMMSAQKVDAVIVCGVLIKGGTDHYHYIADSVSKALMQLQVTSMIPVIFGVLTCENENQVKERATGDFKEAPDWARTAVEMGRLRQSQMGGVNAGKKSVGFA